MSDRKVERLLKFNEVSRTVSLSRSTIYSQIRRGIFPAPIKVTKHASRWKLSEVTSWLESRPALGEES